MNRQINRVEDMEVFKKSHMLTLDTYRITATFPHNEVFALASQMRRAAYSIASNLMEGGYRLNKREYRQFTGIARGSAGELKYFLMLSKDLGYISNTDYTALNDSVTEVSKMLSGLARSLDGAATGNSNHMSNHGDAAFSAHTGTRP